jgi:predicted SAM-dependent methyltransferase
MIITALKNVLRSSSLCMRLISMAKEQWRFMTWYASRPAYPASSEIRLHLGCGNIDHPGFINIDGRPMRHVHHVQRIDRLPNFGDGTAVLVYASHCLEHFPNLQLTAVLQEWCRVLKPGGVLRLSVPDFDVLVEIYLESGRDIEVVQGPLMGGQDYPFNFHYAALNEQKLTALLHGAGFRAVQRWQVGTDSYTSIPDWSGGSIEHKGRRHFVSLNLQAEK